MTISLKHAFNSAKSDGTDPTLVQPSNWNAEHTMTCATDRLLGRTSSGTGAVEEIAISDFMQSLLNTADLTALLAAMGIGAFTTGDVKLTIKTTADSGWRMCDDGTIGSASSGATYANANASALYAVLWDISNTYAPILDSSGVATTRGANAAADFAANKRLSLTKMLGRALAIAGAGSGLTSRSLGQTAGAETVTLARANLPNTSVTVDIASGQGSHAHPWRDRSGTYGAPGSGSGSQTWFGDGSGNTSNATLPAMTGTFNLNGNTTQTAVSTVPPESFLNAMIKL
jgi:hypothetical protein